MVELQELRCLEVLAEELHFGRTADRLRLTQPRVSQLIRRLERRIGAPLVDRTSPRVRLTPLGETFLAQMAPGMRMITDAVTDARVAARGVEGVLRVGFTGAAANELTSPIVQSFTQANPACEVRLVEWDFADPLGALRSGDVDVAFLRLPVREPDLTVGPTVVNEPRVLAVPVGHPFASKPSISVEDLARVSVFECPPAAPDYWRDFHVPRYTPAGREIPRSGTGATVHEMLTLVASGAGTVPMVECMARFFPRPDVVYVPVPDMPWSQVSLVWPASAETARVRAFAAAARMVVDDADGPEAGRGPRTGPGHFCPSWPCEWASSRDMMAMNRHVEEGPTCRCHQVSFEGWRTGWKPRDRQPSRLSLRSWRASPRRLA